MKLFFIKLFFRKLICLSSKMVDWLFVCPQVVTNPCWIEGVFPPEIVKGPLTTMFLKSTKKILRLTPQKKVLRTAPAEGSSSWTVHDLVIRSWPAYEQDHQIIKKMTFRDQVRDLVNQFMTCSWTGSPTHVFVTSEHCLFGPVNHGQNWKGWERSGEKGLIISDNQTQTWLIITINDTSIGDLPLIITISDTCKNHPKRLLVL